jgi:hypothetical protein
MRVYERPNSPSRWVPSKPAIPNLTREHGPAGLCPTEAVPGPHGAPRAAGRRRPRDGPASDASEAAARPLCALRAVASASHACQSCWPTQEQRCRPLAGARSDLGLPQRPTGPLLGSPRQRTWGPRGGLVAASSRPERLRGAVGELTHVRRDVGARFVQRPEGHGRVGEG